MVTYRFVKSNDNGEIIAIGNGENQANVDYHGLGVWTNYTLEFIPQATPPVADWAIENDYPYSLLRDAGGVIISKTLNEIQTDPRL